MRTTSNPVIEVFADIWCPFAHVGLRTIRDQRTRAGRSEVVIWVRAWPLELVNGAPLDAGATRKHAKELRQQVAPDLFQRFAVDRFPCTTLPALALANRAYRTDSGAGEAVSFALREAVFEEGEDISDPTTLERLAADAGVSMPDASDHADVLEDWHEGRRRGVVGSPHFFCGDADAFCPSLAISKDPAEGVSIARDLPRLTDFLEQCLPG